MTGNLGSVQEDPHGCHKLHEEEAGGGGGRRRRRRQEEGWQMRHVWPVNIVSCSSRTIPMAATSCRRRRRQGQGWEVRHEWHADIVSCSL